MLGKAVLLVLIAYVMSSLVASVTTHGVTLRRNGVGSGHPLGRRSVLVTLTRPSAIGSIIGATLLVHGRGSSAPVDTLGIMLSGSDQTGRGKVGLLRSTSTVTSTTNMRVRAGIELTAGLTGNVVRAVGRDSCSRLIMNLRVQRGHSRSFFNPMLVDLLGQLGERVSVVHYAIPVGAMHHVRITVPTGTRFRTNFCR